MTSEVFSRIKDAVKAIPEPYKRGVGEVIIGVGEDPDWRVGVTTDIFKRIKDAVKAAST